MTNRLLGKVAIITGSGRGIGRAIALAFAQEGARVVLAARTAEGIEVVCREILALGGCSIPVLTDVRDEDSVSHLIDYALKTFGQINILVNNAGVIEPRPIFGTSLRQWDEILDTNLRGALLCSKHAWRSLIRQPYSSIINVGSSVGLHGGLMLGAYSASKSGLIGLTKSIAIEGMRFKIRANVLCPGLTETRMMDDIKRRTPGVSGLPPESIAGPAVFLASDEALYVSGQVISIGSL